MWTARDPEGRRVVLTFARWRHIVDRHRELTRQRAAVLRAVEQPEERLPGRKPSETWFYGRTARGGWIRVVVHYEGEVGRIVTAFPRRWVP